MRERGKKRENRTKKSRLPLARTHHQSRRRGANTLTGLNNKKKVKKRRSNRCFFISRRRGSPPPLQVQFGLGSSSRLWAESSRSRARENLTKGGYSTKQSLSENTLPLWKTHGLPLCAFWGLPGSSSSSSAGGRARSYCFLGPPFSLSISFDPAGSAKGAFASPIWRFGANACVRVAWLLFSPDFRFFFARAWFFAFVVCCLAMLRVWSSRQRAYWDWGRRGDDVRCFVWGGTRARVSVCARGELQSGRENPSHPCGDKMREKELAWLPASQHSLLSELFPLADGEEDTVFFAFFRGVQRRKLRKRRRLRLGYLFDFYNFIN